MPHQHHVDTRALPRAAVTASGRRALPGVPDAAALAGAAATPAGAAAAPARRGGSVFESSSDSSDEESETQWSWNGEDDECKAGPSKPRKRKRLLAGLWSRKSVTKAAGGRAEPDLGS
jgi:hypothetical protein